MGADQMDELKKKRVYLIASYLLSLLFYYFSVFFLYFIHDESISISNIIAIILTSPFATLIFGIHGIKDFNPLHVPNVYFLLFSAITFLIVILSVGKVRSVALNAAGHMLLIIYWVLGFLLIGIAV